MSRVVRVEMVNFPGSERRYHCVGRSKRVGEASER